MNQYRVRKSLGQGSFGRVIEALDIEDKTKDNIVAIKQIDEIWHDPDCLKKLLRELRILRNVTHPNILSLRKSFLDLEKEQLYIVTDICVSDLHKFIQDNRRYTSFSANWANIYKLMYQIISAVKYLHDRNIMHRDIKPANILIDKNDNIKLCDFGLARLLYFDEYIPEYNTNPISYNSEESKMESSVDVQKDNKLTEYVVTRWYRAPEVSLSSGKYSTAQDIWSTACTFAELITRRPLFPGRSYIHQIKVIIDILNVNNCTDIDFEMDPNGRKLVQQFIDQSKLSKNFRETIKPCFHLYNMVIWEYTLQLILSMLSFNPNTRISASEAILSPLFTPFNDEKIIGDALPMIPFLYMKDIDQNSENIEILRQLLQTEVIKSNITKQITPRNSTKKVKKLRFLSLPSISSINPSDNLSEERKDAFIRSDLDDFVSGREPENVHLHEIPFDIQLKPELSNSTTSPFKTFRTQICNFLPRFFKNVDSQSTSESENSNIFLKKTQKVFCCLPRSDSCVSP